MDRRIAAMVAVHEQIYRTDQFDRVDVAPYAEHLIWDIAASYPGEIDIDLRLDHVEVDRDHALPLGMIINEVVSNSFKYAFRERGNGVLTVLLARTDDNCAILTIRDDGPGVVGDCTKGAGSKLIAAFVTQLRGEYALTSEHGAVFRLSFPLT